MFLNCLRKKVVDAGSAVHKRVFDNTNEIQKRQAIAAIRNSKLSDEIELWARQLRDEAFEEYISYYE